MQIQTLAKRAIPGGVIDLPAPRYAGDQFYSPIFPELNARFEAPDGSVWQVARPLNGDIRPGHLFAVRGGGLPGHGYTYRWFPLADCTAFGASVSS